MKNSYYKWILLVFLFVTFFLSLGTRQLYNAVLPQIKIEFARFGTTDAQLGAVSSVFAVVFGFASLGCFYLAGALVLLPAMIWLFKSDYIEDGEKQSQGGR